MPESVREQIVQRVKLELEAVVADGGTLAWYAFDPVHRFELFSSEGLDTLEGQTVAILVGGDEESVPRATHHEWEADFELFVSLAHDPRRFSEAQRQEAAILPALIRNRLAYTLRRALLEDWNTWNLNIVDLTITDESREGGVPGWVVAHFRLSITYYYKAVAP